MLTDNCLARQRIEAHSDGRAHVLQQKQRTLSTAPLLEAMIANCMEFHFFDSESSCNCSTWVTFLLIPSCIVTIDPPTSTRALLLYIYIHASTVLRVTSTRRLQGGAARWCSNSDIEQDRSSSVNY
jgi:hypothetical protein